jgi:plastocyanin
MPTLLPAAHAAPQQISAHVGDTIEWVNADIVAHTATARRRAVGTADYYCKFHPNMTGQILIDE